MVLLKRIFTSNPWTLSSNQSTISDPRKALGILIFSQTRSRTSNPESGLCIARIIGSIPLSLSNTWLDVSTWCKPVIAEVPGNITPLPSTWCPLIMPIAPADVAPGRYSKEKRRQLLSGNATWNEKILLLEFRDFNVELDMLNLLSVSAWLEMIDEADSVVTDGALPG